MGAVFKVEFCMTNIFVRTTITLSRKKKSNNTKKLRKLQELRCFAYGRLQKKKKFLLGVEVSWGLNSQSQQRTLRLHGKRELFGVKLPGYRL